MSKSFLSFFLSAHMAQCLCILFAMLHNFLSTFLLVPWQNIFLPFFLSHSCQSAILYIHVPECLHSCLSTYFSSCLHGCLYLYPRSHSFLSSFLLFLGLSVVLPFYLSHNWRPRPFFMFAHICSCMPVSRPQRAYLAASSALSPYLHRMVPARLPACENDCLSVGLPSFFPSLAVLIYYNIPLFSLLLCY